MKIEPRDFKIPVDKGGRRQIAAQRVSDTRAHGAREDDVLLARRHVRRGAGLAPRRLRDDFDVIDHFFGSVVDRRRAFAWLALYRVRTLKDH